LEYVVQSIHTYIGGNPDQPPDFRLNVH
jgi:hypothetical protein